MWFLQTIRVSGQEWLATNRSRREVLFTLNESLLGNALISICRVTSVRSHPTKQLPYLMEEGFKAQKGRSTIGREGQSQDLSPSQFLSLPSVHYALLF